MRALLVVFLAGCPASAESEIATDAPVRPSCVAAPAAGEACTIELAAMPREITAAADGSLYVIDANGSVERHVAKSGCAFERDVTFVSPTGGWRSIEATSDGRVYLAKVEDGRAILSWIGTSSGSCSDSRAYRPVIGVGGDGSVVLAPLTGNGLRRITTAPCGATELAFAAAEAVRALGRLGDGDIAYGTTTSRARVSTSGVERFREAAAYDVGIEHSLEGFGGAIASWHAGALVRVDAATGAAMAPIAWAVDDALFDATPDGSTGYLLGSCGSVYRLTP